MRYRLAAAAIGLAVLPALASAQTPDQIASVANALDFREIGPTIMGGRISDLAVVESDPSTFYVGTATGGVWKTVNNGITFAPVFDDEVTASVGDVTVAPSNPNVVWVGTGEPQNRQSSPWGHGVYRSTDGGLSWSHLGLTDTHHISRIAVHPRDPDVAYVAAVGHLWGSNPERGVYKTTDGGVTWVQVLYVDDLTGAIDMIMDPADPQTLFVAMYQRQRKAWGFNGGGPGSGIYRTTDGGAHWVELTDGLPEGDKGRIGLDLYRKDGNFVCALVEADARGGADGETATERNGVYCSTDRGETWEHRSTTNNRPMYYSQIRIDPNDPERMYLGGANLYRSSDGGHTFTADAAEGVHLDHHALWINPDNSDHLILGSDGGVSISYDRSENWYQFRNLPLAQFYEIGLDMRDPYHVCGGLQDNGSWCAPSDTRSNQGIRTRDWYNIGSGDGFFTVMHPTDTTLMFGESQGGNVYRVDLSTMETARLRPIGRPAEEGGDLPDLRWNWNTPIVLSAHDENTVYAGSNVLFRSTDLGQTFEAISPDLTWAVERDTLTIMGVPGSDAQLSRNDGQSTYGNLTAVAESPREAATIYTGSDDGRVQMTRDGGETWVDITDRFPGLPPYTYVTRIVASAGPAQRVIVAFDGHRNDDFAPYLYVSDDFGESFERRTTGLPASSLSALAEHPDNPRLLFAGNEMGLWMSIDVGRQWVRVRSNLPTVPVDDIEIHPRDNDLVLGTHGRGVWILDDVTPLERLTEQTVTAPAFLFPVRRATSYNTYRPQGWTPGIYAADNPESGARIRYHLADAVDDLSLRVTGATGDPIRTLDAPSEAGMNEVVWDLRLEEDDADGTPMGAGPRVMPGTYIVELTTGSDVVQTEVVVRLDPRVQMARRPIQVRHLAMLESYRLAGPLDRAEETLDELASMLDGVDELFESRTRPERIATAVQGARDLLEEVADGLDPVSDGGSVWRRIEAVSGPPTTDQTYLLEQGWEAAPEALGAVDDALDAVEAVLDLVYTAEGRPELPSPPPTPSRGG